jgi:hypothetical protein
VLTPVRLCEAFSGAPSAHLAAILAANDLAVTSINLEQGEWSGNGHDQAGKAAIAQAHSRPASRTNARGQDSRSVSRFRRSPTARWTVRLKSSAFEKLGADA